MKFTERATALKQNDKEEKKEILPFITQYQPSMSNVKEALLKRMAPHTKSSVTSPDIQTTTSLEYLLFRAKI